MGLPPPDPSSLCPLSSTKFVEPPTKKNSWVRHCIHLCFVICIYIHNGNVPDRHKNVANSGFYCDVLCRLRENLRRRRPELWRTDLAASPSQLPVSHFRPHPAVSGEILNTCHPPPTVLPWFRTLWLLPISKNKIEAERTPVWYHWGDQAESQRVLDTLTGKDIQEAFQKLRRWDRWGGNYFEGDDGR
jgi:hypothetical protein